MQTQNQTTPAITPIPTPAATPAPKTPKSITVTLRGEGTEEVIAVAYKTKTGWRVEATLYKTKAVKGDRRTGQRGATQNFDGGDAQAKAKKALDVMVAQLVKDGWTKPEPKPLGLERKPDAFTLKNLPKPSPAAKK
jgi:hypothetical protein